MTKLVEADGLIDKVCEDIGMPGNQGYIRSLISASSNSAILHVKVSGPDPDLNFKVAQSLERYLPAYCDYYNNQENALDPSHETITMKLIRASTRDYSADNRSSLYKYPTFAGALAAAAVYALFFLVEITNTTIYSADDIKARGDRYSVIGSIAHWALDGEKKRSRRRLGRRRHMVDQSRANVDQKLLLREHVPFRISEAFHELRTNITFCVAGEKGCTIGVISSVAGSGKSFVIANLAVSLSKLYDKKVLLIDGDMRCPMLHKIFSVSNKKGLSNLIVGQVEKLDDVKYSFGDLDLIPSGTLPPNPIDLLTCPRMNTLAEQWKQEYDYILIDLPPIGEVSDALAISGMISGYMFVVRSGYMDTRLLADTTDVIESKGAKIYGYVVTDVHPEHSEGYTKYGHYYKYTKYGKYQAYSNYYKQTEAAANTEEKQS